MAAQDMMDSYDYIEGRAKFLAGESIAECDPGSMAAAGWHDAIADTLRALVPMLASLQGIDPMTAEEVEIVRKLLRQLRGKADGPHRTG